MILNVKIFSFVKSHNTWLEKFSIYLYSSGLSFELFSDYKLSYGKFDSIDIVEQACVLNTLSLKLFGSF